MFFTLAIQDKYISTKWEHCINLTDDFENMVRQFFKEYGVVYTGFSNSVSIIYAYPIIKD